MFWRGDPTTGAPPPNASANWPRNGALLKGVVHTVKGEPHLKVYECKQKGESDFKPVPEGSWMIFSQGGQILFRA